MNPLRVLDGVKRLFRHAPRNAADVYADVDAELESIISARIESLMTRGMSYDDARREAIHRLGDDIDRVRERLHHSAQLRERRMRLHEFLDDVAHDLRYAARGLRRRPGFTAVAVLTLAIGIGATTAIFSAVNVMLIRPLPYAAPSELMKVSLSIPAAGGRAARDDMSWSYPKFTTFRDAQQIFSSLALYTQAQLTITSGDVEIVRGEQVGATYLRTLGIVPVRGRDFEPSVDAHAGAERQLIISHAFWDRRYNLDPDIIGKTIDLDRSAYTIIGVTPRGFDGLNGASQMFFPITTRPADQLNEADSHEFYAVGRRKPAITASAAAAAVEVLGAQVKAAHAGSRMGGGIWGANARPLDDARVSPIIRRSLLILLGAVAFVLLIACVNVANLVLGRASARRREIAVRLAIGAGRGRLIRLVLTESLLLALIGGAASVMVAWLATRALAGINPAGMLRGGGGPFGVGTVTFAAIALDWSALAFTFAITLLVGLVFGLAPTLDATRLSLSNAMKGVDVNKPHASAGRRALVVTEVALVALVLLVGSGLMIRSLTKLLAIDAGFDARNVLTLRLTIPPGSLGRDSMPGFYTELLDRVRAVPGVLDAALNNCAPLSRGCNGTRVQRMDRPEVDLQQAPSVGVHWASPTWFAVMRVPLKQGRVFTDADRVGAPKVVLINETAARAIFPNENPIGKRIGVMQGGFADGAEIVGVVGDVRQNVDSAAQPQTYLPYHQSVRPGMLVFVRTRGNPAAVALDVRRAIQEIAPQFPVYDVQPMTARAAVATAQTRFNAVLLGSFAATALALALVGIYGVMSLAVAARTREIGIRIALGADQRRVQRLVVGEGLALVSVGAAIGIAGALWSTRVLQNLLYDLEPSDPLTYGAILAILVVTAIAASWIPARRAARVDPVVALRTE